MGLLKLLKSPRIKKNHKKPNKLFPNQKQIIKYAFSIGGKEYYQFDDIFALPYERGLMAIAFYHEVNMRCSREYLIKHVEAISNILHNSNKIDVFGIDALNNQMKERLDLVVDVDLLYKLASVVFFDELENPCLYEMEYNQKKIEQWKKNSSVGAFFLQQPIQELIPFLKSVEVDLDMYSPLNEKLNQYHLERIQALNSKH